MFTKLRLRLSAIAFAASCLLFPAAASALTVQEIILMSQQGVSEDVLVNIIQNADQIPELTESDYQKLREANIPQKVQDAIAQRAPQSSASSTPAPANPEPAPAPSSPAPESAPAPADAESVPAPANPETSSVQETPSDTASAQTSPEPVSSETEVQAPAEPAASAMPVPADSESVPAANNAPISLDDDQTGEDESDNNAQFASQTIGDNTILAPVESSNIPLVFRKFFEEAYETYMVQAEVARRYAKLQDETASERAYDAEVPKVHAWRHQIPTKPVASLESCLALSESLNPPIDSLLGAAANQCIGFALKQLGAPGMSAVYLDRALQSKAKLQDFSKTLTAFLQVAHTANYTTTDPQAIKAHEADVEDDDRNAFLYFIGYSLVYGPSPDVSIAGQLLQNVTKGSIYYPRARLLLATLAVRAPEYKFKTAAEYIQSALDELKLIEGNDAYELTNTAWLALARIAYENHAYDAADSFYRKIDVNSHHLKNALLEDAWGQLFAGNHGKALALTHALRAPIFAKAWLPDLLLIEAGAFIGLCRYDSARRALDALHALIDDANLLKAYVAQTPTRDFYNQIIRHAESDEYSPIPDSIYKRVINDATFRVLHQSIRQLTLERNNLSQYVSSNFTSWPKLQAIYDELIAQRQQYMATVIANIYDKTLSEIHAIDISASQVSIEIRLALRKYEAECLKIVANGGKCDMGPVQAEPATFQKRSNEAYWDFKGEFWRDEIWFYTSGLTSLCLE
ncbi:MAG: hypothetical protein J6A01_05920 [Proteobacteria bacterium]|nr:hypothetical protein [Pseudomonadota bacterium]